MFYNEDRTGRELSMMPTETTNTTQAQAVTGIEPDSIKFETLLACLTTPERGQVMQLINSLLIGVA